MSNFITLTRRTDAMAGLIHVVVMGSAIGLEVVATPSGRHEGPRYRRLHRPRRRARRGAVGDRIRRCYLPGGLPMSETDRLPHPGRTSAERRALDRIGCGAEDPQGPVGRPLSAP